MAQLGEAVSRYHKLLEQEPYSDLAWAEEFQETMRRLQLAESGRPVAPILRPHFISHRQLDTLGRITGQLAEILDRVESIAFASPHLLNRLQMLPAEKMLAAVPYGYSRFGVTSSMEAHIRNGSLCLSGFEACRPAGLAYADCLADIFLELPLVKDFKRGRYKLSKLGAVKYMRRAIDDAWREFKRDGSKRDGCKVGAKSAELRPAIAIVDLDQDANSPGDQSHLLAELLNQQGADARVVSLNHLEYAEGRLRVRDFAIDVVLRLLLTRELLTRFDLSHPLLRAYRDGAVCVVNSFRAEFAQRRSLFDLLTDETVTSHLPADDRKLIRNFVPWTRIVSMRKTRHNEDEVDLPEFILRAQENVILLPVEDRNDQLAYVGAEMTPTAWDRAVRLALRTPYVVQERKSAGSSLFPVFQYGDLRMKEAEVTIHPHLFNGRMRGASAVLHTYASGLTTHLAVAPVLLLEEI